MTRMRGGGRSLRIRSSAVSFAFFGGSAAVISIFFHCATHHLFCIFDDDCTVD